LYKESFEGLPLKCAEDAYSAYLLPLLVPSQLDKRDGLPNSDILGSSTESRSVILAVPPASLRKTEHQPQDDCSDDEVLFDEFQFALDLSGTPSALVIGDNMHVNRMPEQVAVARSNASRLKEGLVRLHEEISPVSDYSSLKGGFELLRKELFPSALGPLGVFIP